MLIGARFRNPKLPTFILCVFFCFGCCYFKRSADNSFFYTQMQTYYLFSTNCVNCNYQIPTVARVNNAYTNSGLMKSITD